MQTPNLNHLAEELTRRLEEARQNADPGKPLKNLMQEAVERLDLVTREDYERLLQIHQRTRARVDDLSKRLDALETRQKNC